MFHLYGVMEDIEGPDTAGDDVRGLGEALGSFRNFFCQNQTTGLMVKNMAYGDSFWAPEPPKLTFIGSKRCQFLFILSM